MSDSSKSDQNIATIVFVDRPTGLLLFIKQSRQLDFSLELDGVECRKIGVNENLKIAKSMESFFDPKSGFFNDEKKLRSLSENQLTELNLKQEKIKAICFLNTNIQLLISVIESRFTAEYADSFVVSENSRPIVRLFLSEEKAILLKRCHDHLKEVCIEVMGLKSIDAVKKYLKNYMDHTIVGDYSASNR